MNRGKLRKILTGPLIYVLLVLLVLGIVQMFGTNARDEVKQVTYTELLQMIEDDQIANIMTQENRLIARTVDSKIPESEFGARYNVIANLASVEQFYSDVNAIYARKLNVSPDQVRATDYAFSVAVKEPETVAWWLEWLPLLITMLLFGGLWIFMIRQQGGGNKGVMNFGRSRAHVNDPDKNKVTFADVAGAEEETDELREIVDFLKEPKRYLDLGARIPKGVLLVGPPGTGKTLLARAVAGEAGVSFLSISGSDFVELYVGVGASRVRDLFDQAKKVSPAIIFIDEIDAVGRQRGTGLGGGHDEREQTLNQLLVEMDGFGTNQGVVVMAATNRADILDPALLRPGRFDRQVYVGLPDIRGREDILKIHVKNKPLAEDVDLKTVARGTSGFTGADLENLANEAALLAARRNEKFVTMQDFAEAEIKVIAGPEKKSRVVSEQERRLTAYHEAGHAIVMHALPTHEPVHQITIIPRGQAGGMTISLPEEDRSYQSRRYMEEQIVSLLGGRVAEALCLGDISTGASSDIRRASQIARRMVTVYGMSEKLGAISFESGQDEVFIGRTMAQAKPYSEQVASQIDEEVKAIIDNAYAQAEKILKRDRGQLDAVAEYLLAHETMDAQDFLAVFSDKTQE
ncbi:MAG: ATP-dependent zinc metalloprotease FtsH [Oscillospiraceae bacterium]|nr:ATP-dependent zinc metalloprotease FtsH [Oscillospiraceae bacterium]MDY5735130.1 ATP-dependent zinc metalloprotease FtsH [Oscillospiraceae bacterium]